MPSIKGIQSRMKSNSRVSSVIVPPSPTMNACGVPQIPAFGQYYVYASNPKLSSMDRPKNKKPSANNSRASRADHEYHNMMWDPRIYRGATYKTYKMAEEERCKKNSKEQAAIQRKKMVKRKEEQTIGGIARPKTPPHHSEKIGLEDMGIQTEKFLEEITDEVKERDMCTQTDHIFNLNIPPFFCPTKLGMDAETQIEPWELFQFDEEVKPIVSSVIGKIIEQALFETMEEIELDSLREQQYAYDESHRQNRMRLQRLYERERKVIEERERLIQQRLTEAAEEKEVENRVGANLFATSYLGGMGNTVLNDLRREGHMVESDGLEESFIPWLHNSSMGRFSNMTSASTLLDDVIQHVVENREADVADGIWREISAQDRLYHLQGDSYLSEGEGYYDDE